MNTSRVDECEVTVIQKVTFTYEWKQQVAQTAQENGKRKKHKKP